MCDAALRALTMLSCLKTPTTRARAHHPSAWRGAEGNDVTNGQAVRERVGRGSVGKVRKVGVVQFGGLAARRHIRRLPSSPGNRPRAIGICRTPLVYHSVVE